MFWRVFLVCWIPVLWVCGDVQATDKDKLRQAAKMPSVNAQATFKYNPISGLVVGEPRPQKKTTIGEIKEKLTGESSDAEVYLELCDRYHRADLMTKKKQAADKAVALLQKRLQQSPRDGILLMKLGQALIQAGRFAKADKMLRKAVEVAPDEPQCWIALLDFMQNDTLRILAGRDGALPREEIPIGSIFIHLKKRNPSAEQIERALVQMDAVANTYAKAIEANPRSAKLHVYRSSSRVFWQAIFRDMIFALDGKRIDAGVKNEYRRKAINDLHQALELDADQYEIIGLAAILELSEVTSGKKISRKEAWENAPAATRRSIEKAAHDLDRFTKSDDVKIAAHSAEILGLIHVMKEDVDQAAKYYRIVVNLDPARQNAWDMLLWVLSATKDPDLLTYAKKRLEYKADTKSQYVLAKVHEIFNQPKKAEDILRSALKHNPNTLAIQLGLTAILLRRGDKIEALVEARLHLDNVKRQISPRMPPGPKFEIAVLEAIYLGLTDREAEAGRLLRLILQHNPTHNGAREALAALEKSQEK